MLLSPRYHLKCISTDFSTAGNDDIKKQTDESRVIANIEPRVGETNKKGIAAKSRIVDDRKRLIIFAGYIIS